MWCREFVFQEATCQGRGREGTIAPPPPPCGGHATIAINIKKI